MDPETARRRLAGAPVGYLATIRDDPGRAGTSPVVSPHVVPCCFVLQGERVYSMVDDVKPKATPALQRLANLRAHPRASVLVDHYDDDWSQLWWIRVDGAARVVDAGAEHERAADLLAAKYAPYAARRPSGPAIVVDVDRWAAWP